MPQRTNDMVTPSQHDQLQTKCPLCGWWSFGELCPRCAPTAVATCFGCSIPTTEPSGVCSECQNRGAKEIDQLRKEKAWALLIGRAAERADAIAHARERARGLRVLSRSVLHQGRALALNELAGELERSEHVGKAVSVDEQRKCPVDIQNALGGEVDADWVQQVVERLGDIKQPHIETVMLRRRVAAALCALRSERATSASVRDEAIRILEGSNG